MKLSKQEIEKLAQLSQIDLSSAEKEQFTKEIDSIINYVKELQCLNLEKITKVQDGLNIRETAREDKIEPVDEETRKLLWQNIPCKERNFIKTKKIL